MPIIYQLKNQLSQLSNLISNTTIEQYCFKSKYLSNATIGGHTRHIIEILQCTINGYTNALVDYVNRERNLDIESNRELALDLINKLQTNLNFDDKVLFIFNEDGSLVSSTYNRELMYNVDHTIHHLALIKVSLIELNINNFDDEFGMAYSTILFKKSNN